MENSDYQHPKSYEQAVILLAYLNDMHEKKLREIFGQNINFRIIIDGLEPYNTTEFNKYFEKNINIIEVDKRKYFFAVRNKKNIIAIKSHEDETIFDRLTLKFNEL